jgi:hypothetical protein
MSDHKGSTLVFARRLIQAKGIDERALWSKLRPEDVQVCKAATASSWAPVEPSGRIVRAAGELAFPGNPDPEREFGRQMAREQMGGGILRLLVRVITVGMVVDQAVRMWGNFHTHGRLNAEPGAVGRAVDLVVEDYARLPADMRLMIAGYIQGLIEMTGARHVVVKTDFGDPRAWRWNVSWN